MEQDKADSRACEKSAKVKRVEGLGAAADVSLH